MRLFRHGPVGREKPGAFAPDGTMRDLSSLIADLGEATLGPTELDRLRAADLSALPEVAAGTRLGPCVARPGKLVCIGLNYVDHAEEAGMAKPQEPIFFLKATSAYSGPNDPVRLPRGAEKGDWEVELGGVIGSRASDIEEADALSHVAGYCVFNDVSERAFQIERGGQWTKGKSADTFAPTGPWLVTPDEVPDPQNLRLTLDVNGQRFQDGTTASMIFPVSLLIAYVSQFMTLLPGDIVATGTPAGVGMGQRPQRFLRPGDVMRLEIEGLGVQEQKVVAAGAA